MLLERKIGNLELRI